MNYTWIKIMYFFILNFVVNGVFSFPSATDKIHLEKISTLYLPYGYDVNGIPEYKYNHGAVEQTAYDPENHVMYVIGGNILHIIDISNTTSPRVLTHMEVEGVDLTDIEVCGDHVFISMDNLASKEEGRVVSFQKYSKDSTLIEIFNITVGSLPDMILPTKDCKTILVAIEAEAYQASGQIIDPEGGVGIIKLENGAYTYKKLDFRHFNSRWSDLEDRGLRFIYRENNNSFSNDAEPEYITYSKDESKAYVSLQENNAIAVVDLKTETIADILPLGFKDWSSLTFDASDRDGNINMKSWPVYGMYQPDSIHTINVGGESFLVTSNEGDSKDYSVWGGFNEEIRVKDARLSDDSDILTWAKSHNISTRLQDLDMLGRLKITTVNGRNSNGTFDALYAFGGRSFSIRRLDNMELVYDSMDHFEQYSKQYWPYLFNSNGEMISSTQHETFDSRSDDKGPETESLAVAHIGNEVILFLGNERPGSIFIYKITTDARNPQFQSAWHGIPSTNETWGELFTSREISGVDPEDIRFISAEESPSGEPLLTVAGTVCGTFSIFKVHGTGSNVVPNSSHKSTTVFQNLYTVIVMVTVGLYLSKINRRTF